MREKWSAVTMAVGGMIANQRMWVNVLVKTIYPFLSVHAGGGGGLWEDEEADAPPNVLVLVTRKACNGTVKPRKTG